MRQPTIERPWPVVTIDLQTYRRENSRESIQQRCRALASNAREAAEAQGAGTAAQGSAALLVIAHPVEPLMKRSQSRFTLIEAMALIAIMMLIVISATPRFTAHQLTANICSFPDFHHHAECLGTGKDRQMAKNR